MKIERIKRPDDGVKQTTIENWLMYGGGILLLADLIIFHTASMWLSMVGCFGIFSATIYIFWHYRSRLKTMHFWPRIVKRDD